jgi:hypothetical protein
MIIFGKSFMFYETKAKPQGLKPSDFSAFLSARLNNLVKKSIFGEKGSNLGDRKPSTKSQQSLLELCGAIYFLTISSN